MFNPGHKIPFLRHYLHHTTERNIFYTSQNAIWSHVLHAVFLFRQFSSWVTQTFGFLTQELTDQAPDPGKFVPTVYLICWFLIFCDVVGDYCCVSAYSVGLQASTESNKIQYGGHVVEIRKFQ